jgi:hypothetical protein
VHHVRTGKERKGQHLSISQQSMFAKKEWFVRGRWNGSNYPAAKSSKAPEQE